MVGLFEVKFSTTWDENIIDRFLGILVLVFGIFLWVALMKWFVNYFYYMVIIKQWSVIKIDFDLFFREDVQIVELNRVISTASVQPSFLTSFLNYGDVLITLENSWSMVLSTLPKPKKVIQTIEAFKENVSALEQNTTALEENTTALEESAPAPEEKNEEKSVVGEEEKPTSLEESTTAFEEKSAAYDEKVTAFEEKSAAYDEKVTAFEEKSAAYDEKVAESEENGADTKSPT